MYFPKSQIKSDLYTNGNEFVLESTSTPYVGYYFETSNGKYYTGKNTSDRPNQELIKIQPLNSSNIEPPSPNILTSYTFNDNPNIINTLTSSHYESTLKYASLTNINIYNPPVQFIPYYSPTLPTTTDYQIGEFRRYFCKKTNELIYIEINQPQYKQLVSKDPQILWALYQPFFIDWQLIGDKQKVAQINRNSVDLLVLKQKFFGLNQYLKFDYIKYFQ
jgi:hypothetical protein